MNKVILSIPSTLPMKKTSKELVIVSDNRLLAEATGAALVSEGVVSSFVHVRNGKENDYLGSVSEEPTIVAVDIASHSDRAELFSRIRWLAQELRTARIVAIGNGESAECVTGCIESGASTFVLARDSLDELAATVRALQHGNARCSGTVIHAVLQRIRELSAAKKVEAGESDEAALTDRETDVLELVEQGMLNKEIARRLRIAVPTVKNHMHSIFEKLQVTSRRQAVRQGIASGILHCEPERMEA